ncbi:MAG TPA: rod shape-determining protein MreD [Rhodobacteraceae bacterium]|nr:rod shape-determining protein MreD [Paracoccaceae bacterium]
MVNPSVGRKWFYWLLYLLLATVMIFFRLIPSQPIPDYWVMPDLLAGLTFAWILRRPDYLPILLVAVVMLMTDILFLRPPGLMAALLVLAAEFLRTRRESTRDLPFMLEWVMVAGVLIAIMLANRVILILMMSPRPPLWLSLSELVSTIAAYPLVVLFSSYLLGVRKVAPGEVDALGHRL